MCSDESTDMTARHLRRLVDNTTNKKLRSHYGTLYLAYINQRIAVAWQSGLPVALLLSEGPDTNASSTVKSPND